MNSTCWFRPRSSCFIALALSGGFACGLTYGLAPIADVVAVPVPPAPTPDTVDALGTAIAALVSALGGKSGWILQVISIIGTLRIFLKPANSFAATKVPEGLSTDTHISRLYTQWWYKALAFLLDLTTSVKLHLVVNPAKFVTQDFYGPPIAKQLSSVDGGSQGGGNPWSGPLPTIKDLAGTEFKDSAGTQFLPAVPVGTPPVSVKAPSIPASSPAPTILNGVKSLAVALALTLGLGLGLAGLTGCVTPTAAEAKAEQQALLVTDSTLTAIDTAIPVYRVNLVKREVALEKKHAAKSIPDADYKAQRDALKAERAQFIQIQKGYQTFTNLGLDGWEELKASYGATAIPSTELDKFVSNLGTSIAKAAKFLGVH